MRAASIGFIPLETTEEKLVDGQTGKAYVKWELLEFSLVAIPSLPDALTVDTDNGKGHGRAYAAMLAKGLTGLPGFLAEQIDLEDPEGVIVGDLADGEVDSKTVIPFSAHGDLPKAPEDMAWDAGKEMGMWGIACGTKEAKQGDFGKYAKMFAWREPDAITAEKKTGFKLPHHHVEDGALQAHLRGAMAAMGALMGARGGVAIPESERQGVYTHLAAEYKRFDRTAPPFKSYTLREFIEAHDRGDWAAVAQACEAGPTRIASDGGLLMDGDADLEKQDQEHDPLRWNRTLHKHFDIARESLPPDRKEYELASKYLGVKVEQLHQGGTYVPSARMGSFLTALEEERMRDWITENTRNITRDGTECPPEYRVIQLNATTRRDFLVDGIRFLSGTGAGNRQVTKLIVKMEPDWAGLDVTTYAALKDQVMALDFIERLWRVATERNFLKGEAFSLSGEFLTKSEETWEDVFLSDGNEQAIRRMVTLLNERGAAMENRGVLLTGPPGTGKTLSGRVMMNEAKATFIWLSARDFYRAGAFGGIESAFELAKECAPTLLFIEDVDNWLNRYTVDLLKTQMDGIGRSRGVVTVLTTNYPEQLPDALIDRPGRFHDVLHLDLPDERVRSEMLTRWLPDLPDAERERASKTTEGYSGAHIRELATFIRIIAEQEKVDLSAALDRALDKLRDQRELIQAIQTSGSTYRPSKAIAQMIQKTHERIKAYPRRPASPLSVLRVTGIKVPERKSVITEITEEFLDSLAVQMGVAVVYVDDAQARLALLDAVGKSGRVLAERNFSRLKQARDLVDTVISEEEGRVPSPEQGTEDKAAADLEAAAAEINAGFKADQDEADLRNLADEVNALFGAKGGGVGGEEA